MKLILTTALLCMLCTTHGSINTYHNHYMGATAFLWPPPRPWKPRAEKSVGSCGSTTGVGNRTFFPMTDGRLALVAQWETGWHSVAIRIAYRNDPQHVTDFFEFLDPSDFGYLRVGHTCLKAENVLWSVKPGTNATLMMEQTDGISGHKFYSCADVTFVKEAEFRQRIPCFNKTALDERAQIDKRVNATLLDPDGKEYHTEKTADKLIWSDPKAYGFGTLCSLSSSVLVFLCCSLWNKVIKRAIVRCTRRWRRPQQPSTPPPRANMEQDAQELREFNIRNPVSPTPPGR
ncbi:hypothetical protein DOTSEDRAFT_22412 [Dothistroma septosporum NZE10]|uniref:Copper acquisition factor BIM1-like domain-containing protein n=1 Tax=Dothistroma septosporum (strain NZE10 / CBS 128990) TaxID=675120 RepID=N1PVD9_DOTSN|nr:hypothetical protein DOTSEDRAFT_22412 [Dothistroma septosporum NZE10]